ncbi:MAG: DUF1554 domain-containing protein, partial [Spirochaetia bacterium]|nr:DUF1554 domain-containing protein [Spirochaetia bacterium]
LWSESPSYMRTNPGVSMPPSQILKACCFLFLFAASAQNCSKDPSCAPYDGACSPLVTVLLFQKSSKYIFLSPNATNANFGGVVGVDAFCSSNKPAALPGVGSDYKGLVMASTRNQNTNWVLQGNTEYLNEAGAVVGKTNASKLLIFNLTNPVSAISSMVYTGIVVTDENTWTAGTTCTDWSVNISSGERGQTDSVTTTMIANSMTSCNTMIPIYCVQQ